MKKATIIMNVLLAVTIAINVFLFAIRRHNNALSSVTEATETSYVNGNYRAEVKSALASEVKFNSRPTDGSIFFIPDYPVFVMVGG